MIWIHLILIHVTYQVRGGHCHHMLQHAIRLKDYKMVHMLLEAGADVNIPVHIQEYIMVNEQNSSASDVIYM